MYQKSRGSRCWLSQIATLELQRCEVGELRQYWHHYQILKKLGCFLPNCQPYCLPALVGRAAQWGVTQLCSLEQWAQALKITVPIGFTHLCPHCSASWAQLSSGPHQMCSLPCPFARPQRYLRSFVSWFICTIHFLSASNMLEWVLCIAFTLQTRWVLLVAITADTTCDTTARTLDSFLFAWQCHQQLLESCKERGDCGVEYVSTGQG